VNPATSLSRSRIAAVNSALDMMGPAAEDAPVASDRECPRTNGRVPEGKPG
jgi:hypothetical protein